MNLEIAAEQAFIIAELKQGAYVRYANRRAIYKEFNPGDQVYLLIPDSSNKLYARWIGPAEIVSRCNPDSYRVRLTDGTIRRVHLHQPETTKTQQAWPTIEREAYAVIWSLKKFETWIFGSPVELITNHNPLTFITKNAPQSSKLQRRALALQKYDTTISHCPGAKLSNADALSRLETIE
ncbi:uncharacterized protein LOC118204789 [Stegodyphus dumicola]|uniref:uncharacterized protein LOC118204789 n=1 Tax=Stegodyphus dumicola TaxID=202533 RepID=UPI0015A8C934|nr:uncharacterized protein LOC118204789 [Stegodyphus dumicola]